MSSKAHRLAKFARYAPLFSTRVTPQYVLASEAWADWTFLKRIVDLHSDIGLNKLSRHSCQWFVARQHAPNHQHPRQSHRDLSIKKGFQSQVEASEHLCQEQCLRALIDDCSSQNYGQ